MGRATGVRPALLWTGPLSTLRNTSSTSTYGLATPHAAGVRPSVGVGDNGEHGQAGTRWLRRGGAHWSGAGSSSEPPTPPRRLTPGLDFRDLLLRYVVFDLETRDLRHARLHARQSDRDLHQCGPLRGVLGTLRGTPRRHGPCRQPAHARTRPPPEVSSAAVARAVPGGKEALGRIGPRGPISHSRPRTSSIVETAFRFACDPQVALARLAADGDDTLLASHGTMDVARWQGRAAYRLRSAPRPRSQGPRSRRGRHARPRVRHAQPLRCGWTRPSWRRGLARTTVELRR